nr:malonate--CoA ligase [Ipomoea batatas]
MCGSSALPLPVMQQWETITGHRLLERYGMTEVTKESFTDDGFFKTGDAARIDEDGYYIILGRTNADIMKVGGYKLSALEIEAVLLEHPVISECCVLGLPDKDYGEVVCAIVVLDADLKQKCEAESKPALTLQELCDWAKEKLAPYKVLLAFSFFIIILEAIVVLLNIILSSISNASTFCYRRFNLPLKLQLRMNLS